MPRCWEQRGCDAEMQADCPHATDLHDRCPAKCNFAVCDRPTYELTTDPDLVFSAEIDRSAPIKDVCLYCSFFLTKGPKLK